MEEEEVSSSRGNTARHGARAHTRKRATFARAATTTTVFVFVVELIFGRISAKNRHREKNDIFWWNQTGTPDLGQK